MVTVDERAIATTCISWPPLGRRSFVVIQTFREPLEAARDTHVHPSDALRDA